ncbi:MAG TPA: UvrD-helicase domain-containing protein, partial [Polyangiaceae bacterium]|nr:UvrD-helicase domain-containing protein [Polyangiaceae bacterium]
AAVAHTVLPAVRGELARRKREAGQYDFDDMLGLVDQALHGPRAAALASAMRERWRYVLIDEFQDTDETQWSIFRRAFFERESTGGSVLYLLADPKQSIYRFRGADVHTYLRARDEVVAAGGARVALDHNYRATPGLVAAINAIFDPSADRPVFTGGIRYTPVACGRPDRAMVDGAGRPLAPVQVMRLGSPIDLRAMQSLGRWIAAEIRTMTDPARPWRFDGRPLAHSDVFVLTRNAREGRIVGAALRSAGVPHAFYKQDGLFQTDEARDVRTLLLAVEDPEDRARRLSAWLTPFFGLPLSSLERARDLPGSHPLVTRLRGWRALGEAREFDALFESIVVASGIVRREIFFGEGERELTNYLHIFELLFEYGARSHHTLRDVVSALSGLIDKTRLPLDLEGNVQRLESDRRAVQIMTIHKSKGLEAPVVFVVGGFSQPPGDDVHVYHDGARRLAWVGPVGDPAAAERAKAEEREEDQRLMYVALTRAQGRLYVPCATIGKRDGGDAEGGAKALRGPYDVVNRRVAELLRAGDETALAVSDVPVGLESTEADDAAGRSGEPPWRPPPALLAADTDAVMHAELGRARMGAFVTSYTRMKAQDVAARAARFGAVARGAAPEVDADDEARDDRLRGARASGVFLHELLERVPLESFGAAAASRDWALRPEVAAAFDESMAAHGIDPAQRAHAEELVWTAYTTPLVLPGGGRLERIADAARVAREMDFVFPLSGHAALGEAREPRQRGYVRGSIDLAFEHRGLAYFIDWKSDSLASFSPDAVDRHVRAQYEAQARLYSLAIARLLGSRTREEHDARFGGVLYCFLRGLDGRGRGLWSARPTWDELVGWDDALRGAQRGRAAR